MQFARLLVMEDPMHPKPELLTLQVSSSAFGTNGSIPIEHTHDGADVAPPLAWSAVPPETRSIAILVEDPDAPSRIFVHDIIIGIPPTVNELEGGDTLPDGAVHGTNDYGEQRWRGPNPPNGRHRYFFRVYALDNVPSKAGMTKPDLMSAIKGHVLAQGELIGTYDKNGHTHDKTSINANVKQVGNRVPSGRSMRR
jgi:Raf kinase inhibitor-like YbhB/YbcL family protein